MSLARRPIISLLVLLMAGLVTPTPGASQAVASHEIKAALLFSLAQFVVWPSAVVPAGTPLMLCVVEDPQVAEALERTINGRSVDGRALVVKPLKLGSELPSCHIVYLTGELKRTLEVVATIKPVCVFTVSDAARFARHGGIVELFRENDRMRIAVNLDALQRAGLTLSSRLLALAKIVHDEKPVVGKRP